MNDDLRCCGYWAFGNNCGECGHCLATAKEGVVEIRRLQYELAAASMTKDAAAAKAEEARLRAVLLRIFHRCEDWSPGDVRAAVADALGATVRELDGR